MQFLVRIHNIGVPLYKGIDVNNIISFYVLYKDDKSMFSKWYKENYSKVNNLIKESDVLQNINMYFTDDISEMYKKINILIKNKNKYVNVPEYHNITETIKVGGLKITIDEINTFCVAILYYLFSRNKIEYGYVQFPTNIIGGNIKTKEIYEKEGQVKIFIMGINNNEVILKITDKTQCYKTEIDIYKELTNYQKKDKFINNKLIKMYDSGVIAEAKKGNITFKLSNKKYNTQIDMSPFHSAYYMILEYNPSMTELYGYTGTRNMFSLILDVEKIQPIKSDMMNYERNLNDMITEKNKYLDFLKFSGESDEIIEKQNDFENVDIRKYMEKFEDSIIKNNNKIKEFDTKMDNFVKCIDNIIKLLKHLSDNYGFHHMDLHHRNILVSDTFEFKIFDFDLSFTNKIKNEYSQLKFFRNNKNSYLMYDITTFLSSISETIIEYITTENKYNDNLSSILAKKLDILAQNFSEKYFSNKNNMKILDDVFSNNNIKGGYYLKYT